MGFKNDKERCAGAAGSMVATLLLLFDKNLVRDLLIRLGNTVQTEDGWKKFLVIIGLSEAHASETARQARDLGSKKMMD
jgi:hypothetical protein